MTGRTSLYLSQLTSAQRKLIQMSIHLNPMIVANADGNYSLRESAAFAEAVRSLLTDMAYRPLLLLAGSEAISEAALRVMLETHTKDVEGYLAQIAELLAQMPDEAAEAYRRFTTFAIVKVAEASRDGLFGLMGDRISTSEKKVMRRMVQVLELPLEGEVKAKLGM
jgi:tellurite resistance protein